MRTFSLLNFLEKLNINLFFLGCFAYQALISLQGFELADGGFYATFYRLIFTHPESVQYNFMFWFTGIVGGVFYNVFGFLGLLGIRLAGVLFTTLTLVFSYRLLSKHLPKSHLIISFVIILLALNNDTKELNYNTLSVFIDVLIISLIYKGLLMNRPVLLACGGLLTAINIAARIPNLLAVGFCLTILLYHLLSKEKSRLLRDAGYYLAGLLAGTALVLGIMQYLGHWEIFKNAIDIIYNMASGKTLQKATQNSYGAVALIKQCLYQTMQSIFYVVYIGIYLAFIYFSNKLAKEHGGIIRILARAAQYASYIALVVLFYLGAVGYYPILLLLTGLSLIFSLPFLFQKDKMDVQLLAFMGLYLLLYYPFGSSFGIGTAGRYSFWIALPFALSYLFQVNRFDLNLTTLMNQGQKSLVFHAETLHLNTARRVLVLFIAGACLYHTYNYPFFDRQSRLGMTHSLNDHKLKGIYTTRGRAAIVNELLAASKQYLKPGDFLIAYDDIPMIHYVTETVPYLHNSFPRLYHDNILARDLEDSYQKHQVLPVIIKQKIKTTGDGSTWPSVVHPEPYEDWEDNRGRNIAMDAFLERFQYREVWASRYFCILVPGNYEK